jgi:ammonia channel protein AmtB
MRRRTRSLIGTIVMLAFIIVYAPVAMALADSRIAQTPALVQALLYCFLGIAWIFPLMPLISWMQKPDADQAGSRGVDP